MADLPTICALATPPGVGALGIIRVSGPRSIDICDRLFPKKDLSKEAGYTLHFGPIVKDGEAYDEVLLSLFRAPHSYTGEDLVEISCHGSPYILNEVLNLLIDEGAQMAKAGEFTLRAFLNRKMDLSQAEAVADLIASESKAAHQTAMHQMRGGFANDLKRLRDQLIHFASMVELELDFSEEDVEFANRDELKSLLTQTQGYVRNLIQSFRLGNVIKNGVPVVIAGKPNAGKSTLLNALLNEERAIVTEIEGTTRDSIEDEVVIDGLKYRFIDTAGIRETKDVVESIGVEKALGKIAEARVVLYLFDASKSDLKSLQSELNSVEREEVALIPVANHIDKGEEHILRSAFGKLDGVQFISAKNGDGIEELLDSLRTQVVLGDIQSEDTVVTNARHVASLKETDEALSRALNGLDAGTTGDFLAMDIRQALAHLGEITGEITTDDLLDNIFSKFCIGK